MFLHPDLSKISMRTEASNLHPGDLRNLNSYFLGFKFRHIKKMVRREKDHSLDSHKYFHIPHILETTLHFSGYQRSLEIFHELIYSTVRCVEWISMRVTSLITDTKGGCSIQSECTVWSAVIIFTQLGLKCRSLNNFMVWSECARDSHVPTR